MGGLLGSAKRLYDLRAGSALAGLHVQAWSLRESLNTPWRMSLLCAGTDAWMPMSTLEAQQGCQDQGVGIRLFTRGVHFDVSGG